MHPRKVTRDGLNLLTDFPNIGKAGEADLLLLGVTKPEQLVGMCPYQSKRPTKAQLASAPLSS